MKLVLFDIDGTLLWTDGAGRRAVHRALHEVYGAPVPEGHEFDGKTDPQIVRELMLLAGVGASEVQEHLPRAITRYVEELRYELGEADHGANVYPGIRVLLDQLEQHDGVMLGLLTGNVRDGAAAKLEAVGIDARRFRVGAFGSDHPDRPELPAIARARAEVITGCPIPGADVVVIGDTPADMTCGSGIGARAIGVATGRYTEHQLHACGIGTVFADLTDTEAVIAEILR